MGASYVEFKLGLSRDDFFHSITTGMSLNKKQVLYNIHTTVKMHF